MTNQFSGSTEKPVRIFEFSTSVESNIDMFRISRDVNESLALLACKGKGIGDTVRLIDDLAALTG